RQGGSECPVTSSRLTIKLSSRGGWVSYEPRKAYMPPRSAAAPRSAEPLLLETTLPPDTIAACQRAVKPPLIPIEEAHLQGEQALVIAPVIHPHLTAGRPRHDQEMQDAAALVAQ